MLKRYTIMIGLAVAGLICAESMASGTLLGSYPISDAAGRRTVFSVWAGAATSVHVAGTFNLWDPQSHPLTLTSNGIWQSTIDGAKAGDLYKYVINGNNWRRDPRSARVVHAGNTDSIIYSHDAYAWQSSDFIPPQKDELVVYEMHAGTFNDTNPASPGSASLDDARAKLDHVAALGANAVLLMPVTEFPGTHSWGYNPTDLFAVDNLTYGGPDALKRFVDAAHQRGIAVILDVVHNHYGTSDLPGDLEHSLWNFDGAYTNGGVYFYQDPAFAMTRWGPRPDYARPEVRAFIKDNIRMWLRDFRIDGIRWDATKFMRLTGDESTPIPEGITLIRELNEMMDREFTNKISIAEDLAQLEEMTSPILEGGYGFDSDWHAGFHHAITEEIARGEFMDVGRLIHALSYSHHTRRTIYIESHDEAGHPDKGQVRVPVTMDATNPESYIARKKNLLAAGLLLTAPGLPMLLQGQEFLTTQPFHDIHSLDWTRRETFAGIHDFFRDAIHLRRNTSKHSGALTSAGVVVNSQHLPGSGHILSMHRPGSESPDDDVLIVANLSSQYFLEAPIIWPSAGLWHMRLNSDDRAYSEDFGNIGPRMCDVGLSQVHNISIAPWSLIVFSKSEPQPVFESITLAMVLHDGQTNRLMQKAGTDQWTADIALPAGGDIRFLFHPGANARIAWGEAFLSTNGWPVKGSVRASTNTAPVQLSADKEGIYRFEFNSTTGDFRVRQLIAPAKQPVHTRVAVAGNFNRYNPLAFLDVQPDGRWSGEFVIQQPEDARFKFTAYGTMQASWGANGTLHTGTIAQGTAVAGYSDDIVVAGPLDGRYRFLFDDATLGYSVERIGPAIHFESMAMAGNFNQWSIAANMERVGAHLWKYTGPISYPEHVEFKFAANQAWIFNWGQSLTVQAPSGYASKAKPNAANITIPGPVDGIYTIMFNSDSLEYSVERLPQAPAPEQNSMALAGSFNDWSIKPTMELNSANVWSIDRFFRQPGEIRFKFVAENNWDLSWGGSEGLSSLANHRTASGSLDLSFAISEPGVYRITFNDRNLTYQLERITREFSINRMRFEPVSSGHELSWSSVEGAIYEVYATTNLSSGFELVADNMPATAPVNTLATGSEYTGARFFRILEK